ncbi:MAG: hypothetical protein QOI15_123 [Pseudonocardiales bacterium]|jgi:hypothetical protein|nr:hypothetical protein [Pseudonocardiales bacterium]
MDVDDQPVEELLVLRVVDEARRRRVRRAVAAGLLGVVTAGGIAVGLTHRSAAEPAAISTTAGAVAAADAARAEIYAVARARYAPAPGSARVGRERLEFGRLTLTGARARLQVNFVCVPLCGHGEELTLAERDGTWRVVAVRTSWVS